MKYSLIFGILLMMGWANMFAQTGNYDIDIKINNYENDTLVVGYYYGDKQLVKDTLLSEKKGQFKLAGKDTLDNGVYILLTYPDVAYIQFHVNEGEKDFEIEYDYENKNDVKFKGSKYNQIFQDYLNTLNDLRPKAEVLRDTIKALTAAKKDANSFEAELNIIDDKVIAMQKRITEDNPECIAAMILKASEEPEVPNFADDENPQLRRFQYYKEHYFDNIDLGNPLTLNIGILTQKIENYNKKLTSNHPDSIINSLDYLLGKMKPAEKTYRYYLSTFLNEYGKSKVIGYDAIYVHLVDTYYQSGKAPWVSEENLLKIIDNANKIRPALLGQIGSDLTVYAEDGKTEVKLSAIDFEYLILLFWAPDCGHCSKMMPGFVEFNKEWEASGIKTFAICTKHQDKTKNCWEKLEEKNMLGFINGADQYHRSRFKLKYNVSTTPKVFILNKEREILMKNIGSDQLQEVMIEILKKDKREELIPEKFKATEDIKP